MSSVPSEYKDPSGLRTLANYLRSSNGVKTKSATQHEKRVDYFRGYRFMECVVEDEKPLPKWPKTLPKITDQGVAREVAELMIQNNFFHRSEKVPDKKRMLRMCKVNVYEESGYYTWMYEGSMMWSNIGTVLLISAVIGFTLLPIWPDIAKKVLWYISCTFLIFTLSFCLIRALLFLFLWILGYEFWVFPNLFDESLTFVDSFKPIYSFEATAEGQGYYRVGMVFGLIGFVAWAMTQPTEFDTFIQGQKHFLDDLYSGNLLADVAADHKATLDGVKRKVPTFEDLLREVEEEENGTPGDTESAARQAAGEAAADAILEEELSDEEATARILEQLNAQDEESYADED
jgi:translocation protein SEC62